MENLKQIVAEFLKDHFITDASFLFDSEEEKSTTFKTYQHTNVNILSLGSVMTKNGLELDIVDIDEDEEEEDNGRYVTMITIKLYDEKDFHRSF